MGKGEIAHYEQFLLSHCFQKACFPRGVKRPQEIGLLKTLWEKEKMLVTSIFSFSHNVFYSSRHKFQFLSHNYFVICKCFEFGPVYNFVVRSRVNASTTDSFFKTSWKEKKLPVTSNFFFSHHVFYSIRKLYPHLSIFLTLYLYLLLNWKRLKLPCEIKCFFLVSQYLQSIISNRDKCIMKCPRFPHNAAKATAIPRVFPCNELR